MTTVVIGYLVIALVCSVILNWITKGIEPVLCCIWFSIWPYTLPMTIIVAIFGGIGLLMSFVVTRLSGVLFYLEKKGEKVK